MYMMAAWSAIRRSQDGSEASSSPYSTVTMADPGWGIWGKCSPPLPVTSHTITTLCQAKISLYNS